MITMYNVVSEDGFVSRMDRSEDFIPDEMWPRFLDLCQKYGAVILGRKTYETIQSYEPALRDSFDDLDVHKIVVSRDQKYETVPGDFHVVHSPAEARDLAIKLMGDTAKGVLMTSGPSLNTSMLEEGLISKAILDKLPVRIGEGLKLFDDAIPVRAELACTGQEDLGEGVERCFYDVTRRKGGDDEAAAGLF